jgi:hypothetical protein
LKIKSQTTFLPNVSANEASSVHGVQGNPNSFLRLKQDVSNLKGSALFIATNHRVQDWRVQRMREEVTQISRGAAIRQIPNEYRSLCISRKDLDIIAEHKRFAHAWSIERMHG